MLLTSTWDCDLGFHSFPYQFSCVQFLRCPPRLRLVEVGLSSICPKSSSTSTTGPLILSSLLRHNGNHCKRWTGLVLETVIMSRIKWSVHNQHSLKWNGSELPGILCFNEKDLTRLVEYQRQDKWLLRIYYEVKRVLCEIRIWPAF